MIRNEASFAREIAAREAIRDCLHVYCRGIDRCDGEILRSAFWPDAMIDTNGTPRTVEEFVTGSIGTIQANFEQVQHLVTNILIRLSGQGNSAAVESYNYGYHCRRADRSDLIMGGRYVDRFERRNGEWRVAARTVLVDWFRSYPDTGDWEKDLNGLAVLRGAYGEDDPSYSLFKAV